MFNNLIESSSHRVELKRRGSFFLFTVATYALLFVITGVASIYAYDARMEDQDLEVVIMTPVDFPSPPISQVRQVSQPQGPTNSPRNGQNYAERQIAMAPVDRVEILPDAISTTPNINLPLPDGPVFITGRDRDAQFSGPGLERNGSGGVNTSTPTTIEIVTPPPAPEKKKPVVISKGALTGEALELPRPIYPAMAKQIHLQGRVNVQVLIDESGKVISAKAIDGHPIFRQVSQDAAYRAQFSPTKLGEQAVKVSGVITYNFMLQ